MLARVRTKKDQYFIVSSAYPWLERLIARLGAGGFPIQMQPIQATGARSAWLSPTEATAATPIPSVIVFRGVPQCPMVHVRLRRWGYESGARRTQKCRATSLQILPSAAIRPMVKNEDEEAPQKARRCDER